MRATTATILFFALLLVKEPVSATKGMSSKVMWMAKRHCTLVRFSLVCLPQNQLVTNIEHMRAKMEVRRRLYKRVNKVFQKIMSLKL